MPCKDVFKSSKLQPVLVMAELRLWYIWWVLNKKRKRLFGYLFKYIVNSTINISVRNWACGTRESCQWCQDSLMQLGTQLPLAHSCQALHHRQLYTPLVQNQRSEPHLQKIDKIWYCFFAHNIIRKVRRGGDLPPQWQQAVRRPRHKRLPRCSPRSQRFLTLAGSTLCRKPRRSRPA